MYLLALYFYCSVTRLSSAKYIVDYCNKELPGRLGVTDL